MLEGLIDAALFASAIRLSTPLLLAGLGGMYSERSGVVNIALEGKMLVGAFSAAVLAYYSGNPWLGILAAIITGGVLGLLHALACVRYKANHIVSGIAINLLALGATPLISGALFGSTSSTPQVPSTVPIWHIPLIRELPFIGNVLAHHTPLVYVAIAAVFVSHFILFRTAFGLRLRAVGENPAAADVAGVSVQQIRYTAVLLSGMLAGLAGSFLSIAHGTQFVRNMSAGRGFIALAALIFGKWSPFGVLFACLLFGFADALQIRMQGVSDVPVQFVQMIPYALTIIVLASAIGRAVPPAAIGLPYDKEQM